MSVLVLSLCGNSVGCYGNVLLLTSATSNWQHSKTISLIAQFTTIKVSLQSFIASLYVFVKIGLP